MSDGGCDVECSVVAVALVSRPEFRVVLAAGCRVADVASEILVSGDALSPLVSRVAEWRDVTAWLRDSVCASLLISSDEDDDNDDVASCED